MLHISDYYGLHQKFKCISLSVLFACLEPPSFVKKPEPLNVLSGANITFTSIIKGSSPLEVKWFRGSVELVPGHRCSITLQDSIAELELFDVDPLQSGDYTCQVSNEAGKISCTTHLFVKGLSRLLFLMLLMLVKMISWLYLICFLPIVYYRTSQICEEGERYKCREREKFNLGMHIYGYSTNFSDMEEKWSKNYAL